MGMVDSTMPFHIAGDMETLRRCRKKRGRINDFQPQRATGFERKIVPFPGAARIASHQGSSFNQ
jgi:hypothetical protein